MRRVWWRVLILLPQIEWERGNTAEAEQPVDEALEIARFIADHISDAEHRWAFWERVEIAVGN